MPEWKNNRLTTTVCDINLSGRAWSSHNSISVLTAEYASLIAMEFGRNPIVNDEAAFDIYPPYVLIFKVYQVSN